jgi:hypothetical protein
MTPEELKNIAEAVKSLAKLYVELKEQLLREGVEQDEATLTARHLATAIMLNPKDPNDGWKP